MPGEERTVRGAVQILKRTSSDSRGSAAAAGCAGRVPEEELMKLYRFIRNNSLNRFNRAQVPLLNHPQLLLADPLQLGRILDDLHHLVLPLVLLAPLLILQSSLLVLLLFQLLLHLDVRRQLLDRLDVVPQLLLLRVRALVDGILDSGESANM